MKSAESKLAAEVRDAREFQDGYDAALKGEPNLSTGLVYGAGYVYGNREKRRRDKEEESE